jgi:rare lipoprotein A
VPPPTSKDGERPPSPVPPAAPGDASTFTQTGYASWYGKAHQGKKTSSGEPYDMNQLTAAHPTLPMGTRLLVTNLKNGRTVSVRVNDRGPVVDGRILDLSYAAARELDAVGDGVVRVRISVIGAQSR